MLLVTPVLFPALRVESKCLLRKSPIHKDTIAREELIVKLVTVTKKIIDISTLLQQSTYPSNLSQQFIHLSHHTHSHRRQCN